jgi:uncharacterized protein YndB with AHSA1/START domain
MTVQAEELKVSKSIVVSAPLETAFAVFTERIGSWWPLDSHTLNDGRSDTAVFEQREGGRVYERTPDGTEADWGRVVAWEPPHRVVFSWQVTEAETEIEVTFTAEGESTRVDLEHRGWERLGERAGKARDNYDTGWGMVLGRYEGAAG